MSPFRRCPCGWIACVLVHLTWLHVCLESPSIILNPQPRTTRSSTKEDNTFPSCAFIPLVVIAFERRQVQHRRAPSSTILRSIAQDFRCSRRSSLRIVERSLSG